MFSTEAARVTASFGDYKNNVKSIPPSGAAVGAEIDEAHQLFQSAMKELLQYWKDQNNAHILSGSATMKKSIEKTNHAIAAANAGLAKVQ